MTQSKNDISVKCEFSELADPINLKPHPKNPNKHPKNQLRMLAKSIKTFGWRHPIVVSKRSGFIVAGHARRQAAIDLKCKAPIDLQDFDSDEDELAVLLADNILPELAELDEELLNFNKNILLLTEIDLEAIGIENIDADNSEEKIDISKELDSMEKMNLTPFKQTHIMISFNLEYASDVLEILDNIKKIQTVEIEQSSN